LVADGYGKNYIHKYDRDRKYIKSFGGRGAILPAEEGKFNRCHGLAVDSPLVQTDARRLQTAKRNESTLGHRRQFRRDPPEGPAHAFRRSGLRNNLAIAEVMGRVTILGKDNQIIARSGDNPTFPSGQLRPRPRPVDRRHPELPARKSPFDNNGNVIVSEWSKFGRIHKFAISVNGK